MKMNRKREYEDPLIISYRMSYLHVVIRVIEKSALLLLYPQGEIR